MTVATAIVGAFLGLLMVYLGFGVHIGQTFVTGLPAYAFSAIAGAVTLLLIRYVVQKTFGPIIP